MEFRTPLSFAEAKAYDLVNYLQKLGYQPAKIKQPDYWYHSPLRQENTPSFKVNRNLNRWYDHGIGKGGNIIDFAVLYFNCSPVESLAKISQSAPAGLLLIRNSDEQKKVEAEKKIKIVNDAAFKSFSLCRYLLQRKVSLDVAGQYCREVTYELNGKTYFAIGFKNDLGGYELRNAFVKLSSAPKGLTTIQNGSKNACVFEGFMEFVSYLSIPNLLHEKSNFAVLNSLSFFESSRSFLEQHDSIELYLDRDTAGQNYSQYALSLSPKYSDKSELYKGYKDLNDWMMHVGKSQKKNQGFGM